MLVPQSGLKIDNPAFPLLLAKITYWGVTDAAGSPLGITIVDSRCGTAGEHASFVGQTCKIIPPSGCAGQEQTIQMHDLATGTLTFANAFTDYNGAVYQVPAGTRFVILSGTSGGGGSPASPSPSIGLWMFGVCSPAMVASTTTLLMPNLAGFPDDIFGNEFYVQVIHNANAVGNPPESEIRLITDYTGATGTFTTNAFSANVEANDLVCVIHESLITPGLEVLSATVSDIYDMVNALLTTMETGDTLTTDGTVQNLYVNNAPSGVFKPLVLKLDTTNMIAGDAITVTVNERLSATGGFVKQEEKAFNGVQDPALKKIQLYPNRFGITVTIQRTAGVDRTYTWEVFSDGN